MSVCSSYRVLKSRRTALESYRWLLAAFVVFGAWPVPQSEFETTWGHVNNADFHDWVSYLLNSVEEEDGGWLTHRRFGLRLQVRVRAVFQLVACESEPKTLGVWGQRCYLMRKSVVKWSRFCLVWWPPSMFQRWIEILLKAIMIPILRTIFVCNKNYILN